MEDAMNSEHPFHQVQPDGKGRTGEDIAATRRYMRAFVYSLRASGHSARNVKAVLREYADMVIATVRDERPEPLPGQQWKCGDEFLPFHPSASHVEPGYRDGWNACYVAALDASEPSAASINKELLDALQRIAAEDPGGYFAAIALPAIAKATGGPA